MTVSRRPLNDGQSIPILGLGLWQVPSSTTAENVRMAIEMGYRLIDGAFIYENEEGMGEGVRRAAVPRDEIFITTKIWNSEHDYDRARSAIEASLKRIGIETLDLCLVHWPCPAKGRFVEAWKALIAARDDGQVRSIGVSNFNADHLDRIIGETGVAPALNQIEINPRLQQSALRAYNAAHGIATQSWTPLGEGASFDTPQIRAICAHIGKSPAQVILRWHMQQQILIIPRATRKEHLAANLALFDFELSDADMAAIAQLDAGVRCGPDPQIFVLE